VHKAAELRAIREFELSKVLRFIPKGASLLEIGGADGYQARLLAGFGYDVTSVDISPASNPVFPVAAYDGISLPFSRRRYSCIFSSNVVEHIEKPIDLFSNCLPVLEPDGIHIHIVPSASWRLWTSLLHPLGVFLYFCRRERVEFAAGGSESSRPMFIKVFRNILPPPHGEFESSFHEIFAYRKNGWLEFFSRMGLINVHYETSQLFYTGYGIFGSRIPLSFRVALSRFLGSSCHIFVLAPKRAN
jgi:SAM-dependent methyltransferase